MLFTFHTNPQQHTYNSRSLSSGSEKVLIRGEGAAINGQDYRPPLPSWLWNCLTASKEKRKCCYLCPCHTWPFKCKGNLQFSEHVGKSEAAAAVAPHIWCDRLSVSEHVRSEISASARWSETDERPLRFKVHVIDRKSSSVGLKTFRPEWPCCLKTHKWATMMLTSTYEWLETVHNNCSVYYLHLLKNRFICAWILRLDGRL